MMFVNGYITQSTCIDLHFAIQLLDKNVCKRFISLLLGQRRRTRQGRVCSQVRSKKNIPYKITDTVNRHCKENYWDNKVFSVDSR